MTAPRILVTGASGTIGSELPRQLVARGVAVRALSRRPPAGGSGALMAGASSDIVR